MNDIQSLVEPFEEWKLRYKKNCHDRDFFQAAVKQKYSKEIQKEA